MTFLYSSKPYHRESIVGCRPCFPLSGLFEHLFRLVAHLLSFRRSVFGPTTAVLLNHISRDWGDVMVVLLELCWTLRRFQNSSTAAIDYSFFPVGIAVRTLLFRRIFAKFEDLGVVQVGDLILRFFAELVYLLRLAQVLEEGFLMLVGSRTSRSTSWPCSHVLYPAARLQKEVHQKFCNPRCCRKFHRNSSNRLTVPKMILRLGFVDLGDRVASSIWVQPLALSELSEPSGRAPPLFSSPSLPLPPLLSSFLSPRAWCHPQNPSASRWCRLVWLHSTQAASSVLRRTTACGRVW